MSAGSPRPAGTGGRPYRSARREQAAAQTRTAILDAAMRLFVSRGYGAVTVADIAREASVAVPTVYASAGGKSAILDTLIEQGMTDPVGGATMAAVHECQDPREVVRMSVHGVRVANERHHDMIRVMVTAATLDATATDTLTESDRRVRRALARTAGRLRDLGALRTGMTPGAATDQLWFYLGRHAWQVLVADRRWSWDRAERWLDQQVSTALLEPGTFDGSRSM